MTAGIDRTYEPSKVLSSATAANLDTDVRSEGGQAVLAVGGEVDLATVERFRDALLEAQGSPRVAVDLSAVTFMDSSGLHALVAAYHRVPAGGELRVMGLRPNVRKVFEITGLLALFGDEAPNDPPPACIDS
jgi:anti-sigma B factor antagonist